MGKENLQELQFDLHLSAHAHGLSEPQMHCQKQLGWSRDGKPCLLLRLGLEGLVQSGSGQLALLEPALFPWGL